MTPDVLRIDADDPLAAEATAALTAGDVEAVQRLLADHPELANARIVADNGERTLLHLFADFPVTGPVRGRW